MQTADCRKRLFASFLTWLQEKKEGVFVVGAANDVARMPPELLRKGRCDEIFFVDLPSRGERMQIVEIHLRMRKQDLWRDSRCWMLSVVSCRLSVMLRYEAPTTDN